MTPNETSVTLSADTSQFDSAMDRAARHTDEWGRRFQDRMKDAAAAAEQNTTRMSRAADTASAKLKKLADGAKETAVASARGKLADIGQAAMTDLAGEAGKAIANLVLKTDDWNKSLKHTESLINQIGERSERLAARRAEWIDAAADGPAKIAAIDRAIAAAKKDQDDALQLKAQFNQDIRSATRFQKFGFWAGERLSIAEDPRKDSQRQADALAEQAAAAQKRMEELSEQRGRLLDRSKDPGFVKSINDLVAAKREELNTWAMTADQIEIYRIRAQGATEAQVQQVEGWQKLAAVAREQKVVETMTAAIKKQGETFGMTADQIQLYEARVSGMSEAALKRIEQAQQERDAMIALAQAEAAVIAGASIEDAPAGPAADLSRTSSAMTGGSQAAANAIAAARQSTMNANTPQAQNVKATEKVEAKVAALNTKVDELNATMRTVAESLNALSVI